jgi:hypothetical protein
MLCTRRASPPPLSHPFADSPASLLALAPLPTAPPFALRLGATSSCPCHRASPSTIFPSSTPLHECPLQGGHHGLSEGIQLGPAEEDCVCTSAAWLRLRTLLYGALLSRKPAGSEAPAFAWRQGCPWGVMRASFMNGALRELSVGLCRGNDLSSELLLACWLGQLAPASGLA